jgi:hypothetical protein
LFDNKQHEFFFSTERLVSCGDLKRGILKVYDEVHGVKIHPWVYISLQLEPKNLDVNVHPSKEEVHFLNESKIIATICNDFRASLSKCVDVELESKTNMNNDEEQENGINNEHEQNMDEQLNESITKDDNIATIDKTLTGNKITNNNTYDNKKTHQIQSTKVALSGGSSNNQNNLNKVNSIVLDSEHPIDLVMNDTNINTNINTSKDEEKLKEINELKKQQEQNANLVFVPQAPNSVVNIDSENTTTNLTTNTNVNSNLTASRISLPPPYVAPYQEAMITNEQTIDTNKNEQNINKQINNNNTNNLTVPIQDDQPTGKHTEVVLASQKQWKQTQLGLPTTQIKQTNTPTKSTQPQKRKNEDDKTEEYPGPKKRKISRTSPGLTSIENIREEIDSKADSGKIKEREK